MLTRSGLGIVVQRLVRIRLMVSDLPRMQHFYEAALGFSGVATGPEPDRVRLRLGAQEIELVATPPGAAAYPADSSSADLWFQHFAIVTSDIAQSHARLTGHGFTAISQSGPQLLPPSSGGVTAFKFRDPEGHPLELLQFPGAPRPPGIDHSAISVASADLSVAFYAGLGFKPGSRQINAGPEQDRLDALAQAQVDVVALQPAVSPPPHLELLGYRRPVGRAMDCGPGDVAATHLVLEVDRLDDGVSETLVRDPDGHRLVLLAASPESLTKGQPHPQGA